MVDVEPSRVKHVSTVEYKDDSYYGGVQVGMGEPQLSAIRASMSHSTRRRPRDDGDAHSPFDGCLLENNCDRLRAAWLDGSLDLAAVERSCRTLLRGAKRLAATGQTTPASAWGSWSAGACPSDAVVSRCRTWLALLYLQRGNVKGARPILHRLGFIVRLSSRILRYDAALASADTDPDPSAPGFVDNVVTDSVLLALQRIFEPIAASYWRDHEYRVDPPSSYFSYVVPIAEPNGDDTVLASLVQRALAAVCLRFPEAAAARFVELWAHNRPHGSGHQLHFDSDDEGRDGIRHPLATSVLVVCGSCGGPTLVTTQRLGDTHLARSGWLCFPKSNRLFMFDSTLLHGVIPGRGAPPNGTPRRVTLMLAFWRDIQHRHDSKPGAARPLLALAERPPASRPEWLSLLLSNAGPSSDDGRRLVLRSPPALSHVWECVATDEPCAASSPIVAYERAFQGF